MSELPVLIEAAQVALELLREIDRLGAKKLPRKRAAVDRELQQDGSVWARMLLNENLHTYDSKPYKKFKRRFRVPIELFDLLLRITRDSGEFSDKDKQILKTQRRSARLDLLLLAALKCLGCGHSFDTISELNGISEETNRVFFHRWTQWFCTSQREKYIPDTKISDHDVNVAMSTFDDSHLAGCCGSLDNVHVYWQGCPASLRNSFERGDSGPSISYCVVSDHQRRILAVSNGYPGTQNDKTIIRLMDFVHMMRDRRDIVYSYRDKNGSTLTSTQLWFLSDGGYHYWACLQFPYKNPSDKEEQMFSFHLASVRKDIECVFGILRVRWRILRSPMLYHKRAMVDNAFIAACILHNMLVDLKDDLYTNYDEVEDPDERLLGRRARVPNRRYMDGADEGVRDRLNVGVEVDIEANHDTMRAIVRNNYLFRSRALSR